jgi:hypothetical protein
VLSKNFCNTSANVRGSYGLPNPTGFLLALPAPRLTRGTTGWCCKVADRSGVQPPSRRSPRFRDESAKRRQYDPKWRKATHTMRSPCGPN